MNFCPRDLGFDIVIHSATKYLNGHSDIVAGAVVGRSEHITGILQALNLLGAALDPHTCFLLHRGMKTLGLRVKKQNETALCLARHLQGHPKVLKVHYPGLPEHPGHAFAREWFSGFGGMLAFEMGPDVAAAEALIRGLELAHHAPSLGGLETLVTRPAVTSHAGLSVAQRHRQGISDSLIRVSVGIEDFEDLAQDFQKALESVG